LNPESIKSLFISINENLNINFSSQSGSDFVRINLIKNGLFFLISTLGFGVGAGNIEYWMSHKAMYNTGGVLNIHNWWLEILVGYGVVIFIMYIVFYFKLFRSFYRKFKYSRSKVDMSMSLGIMCFMIGYVIGSISSSSNISSEWLWVFWGIAIAYQGVVLDENNL
jgi:teichuronic acid biosynthesis protein TuaE